MNENLRSKNGSLMYEQIRTANLPETDRRNLLEMARTAELLVNGAVWVARRARELFGILSLRPSPKH
jgi:hypothetical protein